MLQVSMGEGRLGGEDLRDPLEVGAVEKGGCSRYFVAELGMSLGDLIWNSRRRGESLQ